MRRAGFTLIEVIIVVALIGLAAIVLLPQLGGGFSQGLVHSAEVVAADLSYASQRAIATGRTHRWTLDLDESLFWIEERVERPPEDDALPTHAGLLQLAPPADEFEFLPVANGTGKPRWLDEKGVLIDRVSIGEDEFEEGLVSIAFSGDGGSDPARVELSDQYGYRTEIRLAPFTGEPRIIDVLDEP